MGVCLLWYNEPNNVDKRQIKKINKEKARIERYKAG
jgi:hypothetical protein